MATEWFVHADGKQYGPLTPSQLKAMVDQGKVAQETPVRMGAEGKWVRAGRVKGLLPPAESESTATPSTAAPAANAVSPSPKAAPSAAEARPATSSPTAEQPAAKPAREASAEAKRAAAEAPAKAALPARKAPPSRWSPASAPPAAVPPVDEPSRTARDLGIGAGILGLSGLLAFWLPFLGVPLSTIGVLLGLIGVVLALVRHSGLWFSVVGSSIAAIVLGVTLYFILGSTEEPTAAAPPTTMTEVERARRRAAMFEAEAEWAQLETEVEWIDAPQSVTRGELRIHVDSVRVQHVPLDDLGVSSETDEPHLQIRLSIEHAGRGPSVRYLGWSGAGSVVEQHVARLADDTGREFVRFRPLSGAQVEGQVAAGNILPGDAIDDLLVFELDETTMRRFESVDHLELELPGEAIGEAKEIRFRIPRTMLPQ